MNRASPANGWNDFWDFIAEVGDRPGPRYRLARHNKSRPFGPDNWYWKESVLETDGKATRERRNAYARAWYQKNPIKKKEHDLKKHYGVTLAEYESLLVEQNGKCAICGTKDDYFNLAVDHRHGTNKVRGLLCSLCNRGIGMFQDSPDLLMKAAEYLKNPKRLI